MYYFTNGANFLMATTVLTYSVIIQTMSRKQKISISTSNYRFVQNKMHQYQLQKFISTLTHFMYCTNVIVCNLQFWQFELLQMSTIFFIPSYQCLAVLKRY